MDNDGGHSSFYAAINRKIMLLSVIIIVIACIVIILFHFYARWFLRRQSRRWIHRDRPVASSSETVKPQGFDASVLKSLPTFTYSSKNHEFPLECAVCISEFEENETCRILTDCKHCFHIDCIDTWLRSHSACPLCRLPVQNLFKSENVTVICEPGCSSSSSPPASTAAADPGNVAGGGV